MITSFVSRRIVYAKRQQKDLWRTGEQGGLGIMRVLVLGVLRASGGLGLLGFLQQVQRAQGDEGRQGPGGHPYQLLRHW